MINITEVTVMPVSGDEKLKAFVTIKISDCLIMRDVKVISGITGLFVAMPAKRMKDGTFKDIVHPLDKATRIELENKVIAAYEETIVRSNDSKVQRLTA